MGEAAAQVGDLDGGLDDGLTRDGRDGEGGFGRQDEDAVELGQDVRRLGVGHCGLMGMVLGRAVEQGPLFGDGFEQTGFVRGMDDLAQPFQGGEGGVDFVDGLRFARLG